MPIYTAYFYTSADWAETTIEADTPELALQRAHQIERDELETLDFASYGSTDGVDDIEIHLPDGHPVALWQSNDKLLRLEADDLFEALLAQAGGTSGHRFLVER